MFYIGYLCGGCRGDKGFSVLLNNCVSCDNMHLLGLGVLSKSQRATAIVMVLFCSLCGHCCNHCSSTDFPDTSSMALSYSVLSTSMYT